MRKVKIGNSKNKKALSAKEAAEYLCLPLSTFYRLAKKGVIKGYRLGGRVCFRFEDIDDYRKNGTSNDPRDLSFFEMRGTNQTSADNRKSPRINTRIKTNVAFPLRNSSCEGEIKDISAGGLRFELLAPNGVLINDPIEFKFTLDGPSEVPLNVKGRVVYASDRVIGVAFRQLDEKSKEEIAHYVG